MAIVQAINVREQQHRIGTRRLSHAGGKAVVVAKADFLRGDRSFSLMTGTAPASSSRVSVAVALR
jgi:hypothetical protein